jgi:hypothetical protein
VTKFELLENEIGLGREREVDNGIFFLMIHSKQIVERNPVKTYQIRALCPICKTFLSEFSMIIDIFVIQTVLAKPRGPLLRNTKIPVWL